VSRPPGIGTGSCGRSLRHAAPYVFHPQEVWLKVHMILQRALQLAFG
jgi:hypothetical protein